MSSNHQIYDQDFYAWTQQTAALIRQGKFSEIAIEYVAEGIESMGKSDKRELISRLAVVISHLLKYQYQAERRTKSGSHTIAEQRVQMSMLLDQSPSLNHEIEQTFQYAYDKAIKLAVDEKSFPKLSRFTSNQCLDFADYPCKEM